MDEGASEIQLSAFNIGLIDRFSGSCHPQTRGMRRHWLFLIDFHDSILGIIAAFMLPKVLQSQQNASYQAIAKEAVASMSQAYQLYAQKNPVTANTTTDDLIAYLNYVSIDSTSVMDDAWGGSSNCSDRICYRLHNGAVIFFWTGTHFGATDNLAAIYFYVDPDGKYTGDTSGGAEIFWMYVNGRVVSSSGVLTGTHYNAGTTGPSADQPWFSWN